MSETKTCITESELLEEIFKNVRMGSDSIINLTNRVTNDALRSEMMEQLDRYEDFAHRTAKRLSEIGKKPKEENPVTKVSAKIGMAMNTLTDSTTPHLAEMLIQGSVMGVTDLMKQITAAEECGVPEETISLAREIVKFEEAAAESYKKFL